MASKDVEPGETRLDHGLVLPEEIFQASKIVVPCYLSDITAETDQILIQPKFGYPEQPATKQSWRAFPAWDLLE